MVHDECENRHDERVDDGDAFLIKQTGVALGKLPICIDFDGDSSIDVELSNELGTKQIRQGAVEIS